MNIKKGDKVLVLAGKEVGKVETVLDVFPEEKKLTVKGLNIIVKHNKPKSAQDKGGIVKHEGKIDVSNVMIVCPVCNKATKVKIGKDEKGKKVRLCKKCGASLDGNVKVATTKKVKETKSAEEKPATEKTEEKKVAAKKPVNKATVSHNVKNTQPVKVAKSVRATTSKKASPVKKIGGK